MPLPFLSRWSRLRLEHLEDRATPAVAGLLDRSFSADGLTTLAFTSGNQEDRANAVTVQPDGKTVVVGWTGGSRNFAIARFHRDGSLDATFGTGGKAVYDFAPNTSDWATCVAVQKDGKIIVGGAGDFNTTDFLIARLLPNGQRDPSFGSNGVARLPDFVAGQNEVCTQLNPLASGKLLVVGTTRSGGDRIAVAQLTATGQLDNAFGNQGRTVLPGAKDSDSPRCVAVRPNGKIVIGANSIDLNPQVGYFALIQLNSDGSFDNAFGTNQGRSTFSLNSFSAKTKLGDVGVQADGKIVMVGQSDFFDGNNFVDKVIVARVSADGKALDPTFGTVANAPARQGYVALAYDANSSKDKADNVAVQPDGKIVVAGSFKLANALDNNHQFAVYRFTKDGVLDTSFDGDGKMTVGRGTLPINESSSIGLELGKDGIIVVGSMNSATNGIDVAMMRVVRDPWIVAAPGAGGPPTVRILTATGTPLFDLLPYPSTFKGGVQVTLADLNGDNVPEIICAPGNGIAAKVVIYNGATQTVLRSFPVFAGHTGGVNLAVGNVLASNAEMEVVVARNGGSPSQVQIYSATSGALLRQVTAYPASFVGGVRVAVGDVLGDALDEIITAPMSGAQKVRIFAGTAGSVPLRELAPYGSAYVGGYNVVVGNLKGSTAKEELVVSPLAKSAPSLPVKVYEVGATAAADKVFATYQPFGGGYTRGLRVGLVDADGDGNLDLLATSEQSGSPWLLVKKGMPGAPAWEWTVRPFDAAMTASLFLVGDPR